MIVYDDVWLLPSKENNSFNEADWRAEAEAAFVRQRAADRFFKRLRTGNLTTGDCEEFFDQLAEDDIQPAEYFEAVTDNILLVMANGTPLNTYGGGDSLGTLSITPEWQEFEISSLDDSLLRVRHEYNQRPLGYALLSSVFSDGSRGIFRRLYPLNDGSRLLTAEANDEFRQAGFNFRVFSIKIHPRTRFLRHFLEGDARDLE